MRHFSYINFIKLFGSLVLLQLLWLVGLLPLYLLFDISKPEGWEVWLRGLLYLMIFSVAIMGLLVVVVLFTFWFRTLYEFLWPEE